MATAHLSGAVLEAKLAYWEAQLKGVAPLAFPIGLFQTCGAE